MQLDAAKSEKAFIDYLVDNRLISLSDVQRLEGASRAINDGTVLLLSRLGILPESSVVDQLAGFAGLPKLDQSQVPHEGLLRSEISHRYLARKRVLPIVQTEHSVVLAVADPFDSQAFQALKVALRKECEIIVAEPSIVERAIADLYEGQSSSAEGTAQSLSGDEPDGDIERLRDLATEAPVVRYVSELISRASDMRASDIHLEPFKSELLVRFRIDGMLREMPRPSTLSKAAIVSRIKLLARLDISERRVPQDGRIKVTVRGHDLDLRVSTYPTLYGESAVIRLLKKDSISSSLSTLGIEPNMLASYRAQLAHPSGVTLVVGPTGSGKTTTLYASLTELSRPEVKIFTVEDPIEYELTGVNQCQIKTQVGLTFASSLRSMLRQDPDVILVGEIRDAESAEICAQAALTGHKVFSTLHTIDATSAVTRLIDLGLAPYLLIATIDSVVGQRLVRKLCVECRMPTELSSVRKDELSDLLGCNSEHIYEPRGCANCSETGYHGRTGIYELLILDDQLREDIRAGVDAVSLRRKARSVGMRTMYEDGLQKVVQGVTSLSELDRVIKRT